MCWRDFILRFMWHQEDLGVEHLEYVPNILAQSGWAEGTDLSKFPFVDMKFCGEMSPEKSTAMNLRVW